MDAAASGLTWLQVAGIFVAAAIVIAGAAYFWARHQRQRAGEEPGTVPRAPMPRPPSPRDPPQP